MVPSPKREPFVGGHQSAIAAKAGQRRFVAFMGIGHAAVRQAGNVVAAVRAVLDGVVDALVRQKPGHDEILDADIAQEIIEIGGIEETGGRLGQHDLVLAGRDRIDDLRLPGALGDEEIREFVIEAAVTSIPGEIFHHGIDHLHAGGTAGCDRLDQIRNDDIARRRMELRTDPFLIRIEGGVLDVDDKECRSYRIDGPNAGQSAVSRADRRIGTMVGHGAAHFVSNDKCKSAIKAHYWGDDIWMG